METSLISCLLGSMTGIVLGLTGAGGGILAVPLLVFGLQMNMSEAVPIALLAVCLSASTGALIGLRQKKLRYRAAGFIALTGVLVAPIGVWLAQRLSHEPLIVMFALMLFFVAIRMLYRHRQGEGHYDFIQHSKLTCHPSPDVPCITGAADGQLIWTWPCVRVLALSGALAGFLSGLLGVGGGFVVVPALRQATYLQMQSIMITSLAVIALVSLVGATSAVLMGAMNWIVAIPFALGTMGGVMIGLVLSKFLPGEKLQRVFAWVAIMVAIGMVVKLYF